MSQREGSSFWTDALSIIPFVGPIAAGAIERGQNRRAIERQNEYNSPKNQLARLREAGLPYAALTNAISGNQSQAQPANSSGISEGISSYVHTTAQRKQLELLEEQIQSEDAKQKQIEAETLKTWFQSGREKTALELEQDANKWKLSGGDGLTFPTGGSNQVANLIREQQMIKVDTYLKENQSKAIDLEMDIKKARLPLELDEIRTRIKNMINEMGIRIEDLKIRKADLSMRQQKFPLELEEQGERIRNIRLEAGMYPLRYHQGRLNAQMSEHQINVNSVIDKLIYSMKEDGMSISEAFFHSIFMGNLRTNPFGLNTKSD